MLAAMMLVVCLPIPAQHTKWKQLILEDEN